MTAWLIITATIHDRAAFMAGYAPEAARLVEQFGGTYVVRAPGATLLEGEGADGQSVVISVWPDRAAAMAFWTSPAYRAARELRNGIADCTILLVGD